MSDPLDQLHDLDALRALNRQARQQVSALQGEVDALRRDKDALTREVEVLLKRISELTGLLAKAKNVDEQLELSLQLKIISERLDALNDETFGSSRSEKRGREGARSRCPARDKAKPQDDKPRTGHGPTEQPKLPLIEERLLLPAEACSCKQCEGRLVEMEGQTEDSEMISVERVKYVVKRYKRQKYRCRRCGDVATAPGAVRLADGGGTPSNSPRRWRSTSTRTTCRSKHRSNGWPARA